MKITDTHIYFWNGIYSNWFPIDFIDPNVKQQFHNSEQGFMWHKAMFFLDSEIADKILETTNPRTIKALGRQIRDYDDTKWSKVRYNIMVDVNFFKFFQNENLKKELLDSGDKIIVEASPYDKIWGVGLMEDNPLILNDKNWQGENLLGKALMDVRSLIRSGKLSTNNL